MLYVGFAPPPGEFSAGACCQLGTLHTTEYRVNESKTFCVVTCSTQYWMVREQWTAVIIYLLNDTLSARKGKQTVKKCVNPSVAVCYWMETSEGLCVNCSEYG